MGEAACVCLVFWAGCGKGTKGDAGAEPAGGRRRGSEMELAQRGVQDGAQIVRTRAGRFQPSLGPGWTMHRTVVPVTANGVYAYLDSVDGCASATGMMEGVLLTDAKREALAANGLRVCLIPVEDVGKLLTRMGSDPSLESTWLGNVNGWKSIATGSPIHGRTVFRFDGHEVEYSAGYAQLLMRGYPLQSVDGPYMWLEVIPHFRQPPDNPYKFTSASEAELIGDWLDSCGVQLALDGSCAVVILPDRPTSIESRPDEQADEQVAGAVEGVNAGDVERADAEPSGQDEQNTGGPPTVGPEPMPILTIGQDVFISATRNRMLVVILIPGMGPS